LCEGLALRGLTGTQHTIYSINSKIFIAKVTYGNYLSLHLIKKKKLLPVQQNKHINDAELLENFYKDHDNKWLGILLPRYTLLLLGVCMKYLKDEEESRDCVQQIFLKVINELHKYRVDYFKSWIYMIAKNHCLMKLRGNKNFVVELNDQAISNGDENFDKNDLLEKEKLLQKMKEALKQLNPEQQQCVNLFYLQKKSYSEISEITGFPMLKVKSHLQNGKRNLKLMMNS